MPNFITDTFTAAAGTTLETHTPEVGGPISKVTGMTGSAVITAAGRARSAAAGPVAAYQYAGVPGSADCDVTCDVYVAALGSDSLGAGPIARVQSGAQTFYWSRMVADPARSGGAFLGFDIYKFVAGTPTLLTQTASSLPVAGATVQMKLSLRGSAITLLVSTDGGVTFTAICSATDAAIPAAGSAGVCFYEYLTPGDSVGLQIDNLNAIAAVPIAPNNSAWFSSPGNWVLSSSVAISADFGAKRSIVVSGTTSASLSFDLTALTAASVAAGDYPQIRYSIDDAPVTDAAVAASVSLFTGLAATAHEIVYEFVRGNFNTDAYTTPVMAVRETGLTLGYGATVSLPADLQPDRMFVAGDSMMAGFSVLSLSNPSGNDATASFAKALGPALGAEVGIAGKGGIGWAYGGQANVPAFPSGWKYAWSGQARTFSTLKRFVVVMGANDGLNSIADSNVTPAVTSWLIDARATLGSSTRIYVVIPFGGFKRSAITAGYANYLSAHPGDVSNLIDLGTLIQTGLSGPIGTPTRPAPFDGIHPSSIAHGQLGATLAAAIKTAETSLTLTRITNNVGGGLLAGL